MTMLPSAARLALCVSLAALCVPPAAHAADTVGLPLGNVTYEAEIATLTEQPDTDDFSAVLARGESFSAKVQVGKKSALRLDVGVFDPDGVDRTAEVGLKVKKDGVRVQFKPFTADRTGRWTVRVAGRDGTEGDYSAKFAVRPGASLSLKNQRLGGSDPATRAHEFEAVDGARLDAALKWSGKGDAARVTDVRGPLGTVSGLFGESTAFVLKGTKETLSAHPLDAGDGTYALEVSSDGSTVYALKLKVTPPVRAAGRVSVTSITDPHLDPLAAPREGAAGTALRITGRNFSISPLPLVYFGPYKALVQAVGGARDTIDVILPQAPGGSTQPLFVANADGQSAFHADYVHFVPEAGIDAVTVVSGPTLGGSTVHLDGGTVVEVTGHDFLASDVVRLGGVQLVRSAATGTSFRITVPAGAPGKAALTLTDAFGRVQTVNDAVHRVGFRAATDDHLPAPSAVDSYTGWAVALGDLDQDGRRDDLVVTTYNAYSRPYVEYDSPLPSSVRLTVNPVGTRAEYTRVFIGDRYGVLTDRTAAGIPEAGSDATGFEDWNGLAVAIGDIDGRDGADIVLGGGAGGGDDSYDFEQLRILTSRRYGRFAITTGLLPKWPRNLTGTTAVDERYVPPEVTEDPPPDPTGNEPVGVWRIAGPRRGPAVVNCLALGDLDGDGDLEIVAGSPGTGFRNVYIDPSPIDYSRTPPYIRQADVHYLSEGRYYSGTRVFDNHLESAPGFDDVTEDVLPSAGTLANPGAVAYPARWLVLGDVDGDLDLDLVVTWSNPNGLIPASAKDNFGFVQPFSHGNYIYKYTPATAQPVIATRVLVNDGSGNFTDETDQRMPAASGAEYWQANRVALADLDGDGDQDMVLLHMRHLDAFRNQTNLVGATSLRVLRNDEGVFTDMTATALPPLPAGHPPLRGRALAVGDVDGDGFPEIVVGTQDPRKDGSGATLRSTVILWGGPALAFSYHDAFSVAPGVDSGEVNAILFADFERDGVPALVLLSGHLPVNADGGARLRVEDWLR